MPVAASKRVTVKVPVSRVEIFGFLLGREMSAIGSGHNGVWGGADHPHDQWLASPSPEGWIAVVGVHDIRPSVALGVLTVQILNPQSTPDVGAVQLIDVIDRIKRAEVEASSDTSYAYRWGIALGPIGGHQNLEEGSRHRFDGVYEWPGVTLAALPTAYEGNAPLNDHTFVPYRVHRVWASGSVDAPSWEIAQRLADVAALRVALFLTLLLRTAIERAQAAASIVQGDAADLNRLFPREVHSTPGPSFPSEEAYAQHYGPSAPAGESHVYKLPVDANELWRAADLLPVNDAEAFWAALASYRTAWRLRHEFPSFGFVALVTAVESLIDMRALQRCETCGQIRGLGRAFREIVSSNTGVPEADLKKFSNAAYDRRSRTLHDGTFHGRELSSRVAGGLGWSEDPAAHFEYRDWPDLESLVAYTLLNWLRVRADSSAR